MLTSTLCVFFFVLLMGKIVHCCIVFFLGYFEDNVTCHFTASLISGLATTYASLPVDIAKTRYVVEYDFI